MGVALTEDYHNLGECIEYIMYLDSLEIAKSISCIWTLISCIWTPFERDLVCYTPICDCTVWSELGDRAKIVGAWT